MRLLLALILSFCVPAVVAQETDQLLKRLDQVAVLIRDNRIVEAERQLAAISRTTPNTPDVLTLLDTSRAKQNRLNEAETLFLKTRRIEENSTPARMTLS